MMTRLAGAALLALLAATAALAQEAQQPNPGAQPPADRDTIWPASLQRIAGKYVYVQVASPGGLWLRGEPASRQQKRYARQVSINELPAPIRDRFTHAEITISDIKTPTEVDASERVSPSRRGMLRDYSENAEGRLVMRNLPGIGDGRNDNGNYSGRVNFMLEHHGHSNPSVSGVLSVRKNAEPTWGAATLDYADLMAEPLPPPGKEDQEQDPIIANARILRSGVEIFAYVEVTLTDKQGQRKYSGCLRLARADLLNPPTPFTPAPPEGERILRSAPGPGRPGQRGTETPSSRRAFPRAAAVLEPGFRPLFNGTDLGGWIGDPKLWTWDNGTLVGRTTGSGIDHNEFLRSKEQYGDFVLKLQARLHGHNSGIQFRSDVKPDGHVFGCQADIGPGFWGSLYDELGRGELVPYAKAKVERVLKPDDWNDYTITCRGDHVTLELNGVVTADFHDATGKRAGLLAFQLHEGPAEEAAFRNVRIQVLH